MTTALARASRGTSGPWGSLRLRAVVLVAVAAVLPLLTLGAISIERCTSERDFDTSSAAGSWTGDALRRVGEGT